MCDSRVWVVTAFGLEEFHCISHKHRLGKILGTKTLMKITFTHTPFNAGWKGKMFVLGMNVNCLWMLLLWQDN